MKRNQKIKYHRHFTLAVLTLLLSGMFSLPATTAPPAKKKLQLAYAYNGANSSEDAQFMNILTEVMKIGLKNYPGGYSLVSYKSGKEFLAAAKSGSVDFTFTFNNDIAYELMKKQKFKPIASYSVYKKDLMAPCIYVKKTHTGASVSSLKGKRMSLQKEYKYMYLALRKLTGERPDSYFKLSPSASEYSALYALALDDADAAFVNTVAFDYTKVSNPGSIKNIKPLVCGDEIKFTPILSSKNPPPGSDEFITSLLLSIVKNDSYKQFKPLFKAASLKMIPANESDYSQLVKLYDDASKNGWNKEYESWSRYILK